MKQVLVGGWWVVRMGGAGWWCEMDSDSGQWVLGVGCWVLIPGDGCWGVGDE